MVANWVSFRSNLCLGSRAKCNNSAQDAGARAQSSSRDVEFQSISASIKNQLTPTTTAIWSMQLIISSSDCGFFTGSINNSGSLHRLFLECYTLSLFYKKMCLVMFFAFVYSSFLFLIMNFDLSFLRFQILILIRKWSMAIG